MILSSDNQVMKCGANEPIQVFPVQGFSQLPHLKEIEKLVSSVEGVVHGIGEGLLPKVLPFFGPAQESFGPGEGFAKVPLPGSLLETSPASLPITLRFGINAV